MNLSMIAVLFLLVMICFVEETLSVSNYNIFCHLSIMPLIFYLHKCFTFLFFSTLEFTSWFLKINNKEPSNTLIISSVVYLQSCFKYLVTKSLESFCIMYILNWPIHRNLSIRYVLCHRLTLYENVFLMTYSL